VLGQVELIFSEPRDNTTGDLMTKFWSSWQQLANEPTSASRQAIVEQARVLVNSIHDTSRQLAGLEQTLNSELKKQAAILNEIGGQLASLNRQVASGELGGDMANDLRDKRNVLLDELSRLANARDIWIPESREALDRLAESLVTQVNALHRQGITSDGRTGVSFFDPLYVTADSIQISAQVADNTQQNIVAGRTTAESDVDIAQALADLAETPVMPDGRTTLNGDYDSVVATIGMRSMEATNVTETQTLLVEQLENHRPSVMGVSLDEERAQMIKFQHAYEAAARVITTWTRLLTRWSMEWAS
jgi:flagellar hook-associated protein 1 FlgK